MTNPHQTDEPEDTAPTLLIGPRYAWLMTVAVIGGGVVAVLAYLTLGTPSPSGS